MPKEYKQKCRDVWLKSDEFKAWIRRDDTDQQRVYCNYCKITITAKLSDLLPDNFKILKQIDVFSVTKILCAVKKDITDILEFLQSFFSILPVKNSFLSWSKVGSSVYCWQY
ncbi:uncharacterized protein LOC126764375 [Bactrocera neohumeralis]|uniref:uncharacterized protein LOC120780360 n=1 Tax=Bactrocera tryoni TaxID=59916 RepID=UPI001A972BB1|nr:uncharacterized protein LOC120780360 [Bactrocera tryoni]XP_050338033.1 uncharacterized protein LOC126764375 [Bactrocera neohumeralis]